VTDPTYFIMPTYRVDNVPRALRPMFLVFSYCVATVLFAYAWLVRVTSDIEFEGAQQLETRNYVFCHWHTFIPLYFAAFNRHKRHAWMQHPNWYMKPIHILLRWLGVERIVLGSSGHEGRRAADELVQLLVDGYSTVVFPDGPAGPPFVLRKGVLHISEQSGVPVMPMRFTASRYLRLPTWDRKFLPLPFGSITVIFGPPLTVRGQDVADATSVLVRALGPPC
jgi:lysophospholipid acyltransferase (LPLAT)-like uncharacterized protein